MDVICLGSTEAAAFGDNDGLAPTAADDEKLTFSMIDLDESPIWFFPVNKLPLSWLANAERGCPWLIVVLAKRHTDQSAI